MRPLITILATFLCVLCSAPAANAAVTSYSDRATYNAAAAGLGTPTNIDFMTRDNGEYITNPGSDVYFNPLTLRGVSFEGQSYYNDTLYEFQNGTTGADLPSNTYALGFDMWRFYGSMGTFTITLSTGHTFSIPSTAINRQFFGAIADQPIKWVRLSFDSDYFVMDNFVYGANGPIASPTPPLLSGVVSHWPGEGNTNDVVGPNNGTFQNGSGYATGVIGQAFSLDGVNRYITAPDSPSLSLADEFTLEARVSFNATNRQQAIIEKYDVPGRNGYFIRLLPDGRLYSSVCDAVTCGINAVSATVLAPSTWYHVAAVYNGGSIRIYVDGVLDGLIVTDRTLTDGSANLKIGARGDDGNTRFGGLIDEARIHNRALSASEVMLLVPPPPLDSTPPVIVPTVTGTLGNNGWYTSNVEVIWSVTDLETSATSSGCSASSVTADTAGVTFTCSASSEGGTSTESVTIKRDATAPTITIASPTGGNYLLNQAAVVIFTCNDAMAGIASCSGSAADGSSLDTSTVGVKALTVNTADNAGNSATMAINYTVGYGVVALYDQTKTHKAGSTVPIKIRLVDANVANVSSSTIVPHALSVIQVSSQVSSEFSDAGNSNPDFDFRYDSALGGYIFNLKTTGLATGTYLLSFSAGSAGPYAVGFQVRQ
jgi:hypothetical protein